MKTQDQFGLFSTNKWGVFFMLCLATLVLLLVKKNFIEAQTTAFMVLEERGEMGVFHMINGLQYLTIPVVYLYKFTVISFVIWVGCFMFGYRVTYSQVWHIAIISETVFLVPEIIKIGWFLFVEQDVNFFEIRNFYPLALINLADTTTLADRYFYPLKALNIFEVLYWLMLAYCLSIFIKKSFRTAFLVISCSYILFFFLWLLFFTLVYK